MQKADQSYRTLYFLVRHGDWIAVVTAVVPVIAGAVAWGTGESVGYLVAGILAGAFILLMMRSYVELVRVIVDMLLPK